MKLCSSCRESLQILLLLLSALVTVLCQKTITGIEGQSIVLPCSYKVRRSSDLTTMCWGRGSCPNSKCNQQLIWTDGRKVTFQSSSRYELKERINQGIVSLTIAEVSLEDAGTYCCRIEHQGWFNDEKINIQLTVERAPTTVRTTTLPTTTTKTTLPTTTTKTTPAPSTVKTTPTPPAIQTTPEPTRTLTTHVEVTTEPTLPVTEDTSPHVIRTETATYSKGDVPPSGTAETIDLTPKSSDVPGFVPEDDLTTSAESNPENKEHATSSLWPESHSPNDNGISDLFQANVTAPLKKDKSTIIIAISLTVIALIVICVILLQLKGQKRARYLLGLDPHLELVSHAEDPTTELQAEANDPNKAEEAKTNHIGNTSEA
ncbi:uncharacterized protein RB166_009177 isoform 2-T2 [Leptodactylus fuscus]|uniref:uncharacterized protein LOC142205097 isoform X2 n=1 Tax=Leptodactylus fuscus TaxID=238119 RepID=UPI003F4EF872